MDLQLKELKYKRSVNADGELFSQSLEVTVERKVDFSEMDRIFNEVRDEVTEILDNSNEQETKTQTVSKATEKQLDYIKSLIDDSDEKGTEVVDKCLSEYGKEYIDDLTKQEASSLISALQEVQ